MLVKQKQNLGFYVKSILENLEVLKQLILSLLEFLILLVWNVSVFKKGKDSLKSKFRASKCVVMAYFALLESPDLI